MKYLVLGSDGQIGSSLTSYLKLLGNVVDEYDIASSPDNDLRVYSKALENRVSNADFIFFLAFDVGGSVYLEKHQNTNAFLNNNMKIMLNTFSYLEKTKKPFIFASSQMSSMTHSNYGLLKLIGERYTENLNGLTVKFWNVYGHETDPDKTHVITDFIKMANEQNQITMRTSGDEERQFLHADDCSKCLYELSNKFDQISPKEELCVTNFEWTSIYKIAQIISRRFNDCEIVKGVKLDDVQRDAKNTPSEDILKYWKPEINLIDGIDLVIKSYS